MKSLSGGVLFFLTLLCMTDSACAQGVTAVPFLTFPTSPEGNGMGGIFTSVPSLHAMAPIGNPAQLGLFSLENSASVAFSAPKTEWLPEYSLAGLSLSTTAVNVGVNFRDLLGLPVPVSVGVGYSRISLNLGSFVITNSSGPTPIGTFESYEKSEQLSFGLGIDYVVRVGFGVNFKFIESSLSPVGSEQELAGAVAQPKAIDLGLILQVPLARIISDVRGSPIEIGSGVRPFIDLNLGFARRNIGDGVSYVDVAQADPLPRTADVGASIRIGVSTHVVGNEWNLFSFVLAREAEQLLVQQTGLSWDYVSGFGQINFIDNVLGGRSSDLVGVRKGLQFEFAEFFYLRGGSLSRPGLAYSTSGFGLRLSGLIKGLAHFSPADVDGTWIGWVLSSLDLQYDHSSYVDAGRTTFGSLNLIVRKIPF